MKCLDCVRSDAGTRLGMIARATQDQAQQKVADKADVNNKPSTAVRRTATEIRLHSQAGDLELPPATLLQQSARRILQRRSSWSAGLHHYDTRNFKSDSSPVPHNDAVSSESWCSTSHALAGSLPHVAHKENLQIAKGHADQQHEFVTLQSTESWELL